MVVRTPLLKFQTRPDILLRELNAAWADARAGRASRADTIDRYIAAGLNAADAVAVFDIQWAGFLKFPHDPKVGDLGYDAAFLLRSGRA